MTDTHPTQTPRRCLVVLTMHRSGSSAIARVLNLCGLSLPRTLIGPARDNERGFWESREIMAISDRILASAGLSWDAVGCIGDRWWHGNDALEARAELAATIANEIGDADLFVLKDPRFCHFVPLLAGALADLGVVPSYVIMFRNPLDVAASLRARDGLPFQRSMLIWLRHIVAAERDTRNSPRAFLRYDDLLSDCSGALDRIARTLDIRWPAADGDILTAADEFLTGGLRHHHASDAGLDEQGAVPAVLPRAFRNLLRLVNSPTADTAELTLASNWLVETESIIAPIDARWQRRETERSEEIDALEQQLRHERAERQREADNARAIEARRHDAETALARASARADELAAQLAAERRQAETRAGELAALEQRLAQGREERDAAAAAREAQEAALAEAQEGIAHLQHVVEQTELHKHAVERQLAAAWDELTGLRASRSWRWTAPLRFVFDVSAGVRPLRLPVRPRPLPSASESGAEPADDTGEAEISDPRHAYRERCETALDELLAAEDRLVLPAPDQPAISVILILYNQAPLTFGCLRSLATSDCRDFELIIVDNGSTDRTHEMLERLDGPTIIRNQENLHFLKGVNQAARHARGDYLLLLNNDAHLDPAAMDAALAVYGEQDLVGAVGGKVVHLTGTLQEAGSIIWNDGSCLGYARGSSPDAAEANWRRTVDYCSGVFLLTPRAVFESLGGFDESFAPAYYEDTDYCMRLRDAGLAIVYEPACVIHHHEFGSSDDRSAVALMQRNQAFFRDRHAARLAADHLSPRLENVVLARSRTPVSRRVLFIDDKFPHRDMGQGFPRANRLVTVLADRGYEVTILATNQEPDSTTSIYRDLPRSVECVAESDGQSLSDFLKARKGSFGTAIVSRPHNMRRLGRFGGPRRLLGDARLIYDAEAIFADREAVQLALAGTPLSDAEHFARRKEELELAVAADAVTVVGPREAAAFGEFVADTHVLGHWLDPIPGNAGFDDRGGFLFVGAMPNDDNPNVDGMLWFHANVWPRVQQVCGAAVKLNIAGLNQSQCIWALHGGPVNVLGEVADLRTVYERARVVVIPTRYAAGIPFKAHEAASHGVPMVTTELIAEQLGWANNETLLAAAADDPSSFADACVKLHEDAETWNRLREDALRRLTRECSQEAFVRGLTAALGDRNA